MTWTLRDIRRMAARGRLQDTFIVLWALQHAEVKRVPGWGHVPTTAAIDRAITALGPRWPLAEARPKGTDEVNGSRQTGDATHGGDGASGEVNNKNCEGHQSQVVVGAEMDSQSATWTGKHSGQPDRKTAGNGAKAEREPHAGEVTAKTGLAAADADNPQRDAGAVARASASSEKTRQKDAGESVGEATSPCAHYGGNYATAKSRLDTRSAREVARALRRLFASWDIGGLDESPRVDARKLVRELVSRRANVGRALRREKTLGKVLLMADVSGSCSAAASDTVAACKALARELDNVIFVMHSNGWPINGARVEDKLAWWRKKLEEWRPIGAVNFGDWDAADVLREIAGRCKLVWLDSYAARWGARPCALPDWRDKPIVMWQGVNSAGRAAVALRMAARKGERG